MTKNLFNKIKESLRDLIYGRIIPPLEDRNVMTITVDIRRGSNPVPPVEMRQDDDIIQIAIRAIQSQDSDERPIVLPFEDPTILDTITDNHRELIFKFVLRRINRAIQYNLPIVNLFQFGSSPRIVQVSKKNFETQLNSMMDWFVKTEDYESASNCRDLIRKIKSTDAVDQ